MTLPGRWFTYTVTDQNQRSSAGRARGGILIEAPDRLAGVVARPVLTVGIDRGVTAGRAHGERHDELACPRNSVRPPTAVNSGYEHLAAE